MLLTLTAAFQSFPAHRFGLKAYGTILGGTFSSQLAAALKSKGSSTRSSLSMMATQIRATRGDGLGGDGITMILPSKQAAAEGQAEYDKVVIWLHGLGDTADGWAPAAPELASKLMESAGGTKFILPTAPSRSITLNMGMSMPGWSDILGLSEDAPEDEAGFNESADRVGKLVEAELGKNISPRKIAVGGFSQGGAVALHYCMRTTHSIGCCLAFSSWLPLRSQYPEALADHAKSGSLQVLQCHGDSDNVVQMPWGKQSNELMAGELGLGSRVQWEVYSGMGHSACPEELQRGAAFLQETLASVPSGSS